MNRRFFTCQENRKTVKQLFEIDWKCGGKILIIYLYIINYLYYLVFGVFSLSKNCFTVFLFFGHFMLPRFFTPLRSVLNHKTFSSHTTPWRLNRIALTFSKIVFAFRLFNIRKNPLARNLLYENGHKRTKTDIGSKIIRIFVPHKTKNWRL